MVVKQPCMKCLCGQALQFPEGQIKTNCRCGAVWELGIEGFWSVSKVPYVTFLIYSRKRDLNRYQRYMRWRSLRKAGLKC